MFAFSGFFVDLRYLEYDLIIFGPMSACCTNFVESVIQKHMCGITFIFYRILSLTYIDANYMLVFIVQQIALLCHAFHCVRDSYISASINWNFNNIRCKIVIMKICWFWFWSHNRRPYYAMLFAMNVISLYKFPFARNAPNFIVEVITTFYAC